MINSGFRFATLIMLPIIMTGCVFGAQKGKHVYHLLGTQEESAQMQAEVLKMDIPASEKIGDAIGGQYWKLVGENRGWKYYLNVGSVNHVTDRPFRMKLDGGKTYVHVKPYNFAFVKLESQDGSYDTYMYSVGCYDNLLSKSIFEKYTADHKERKVAGGVSVFLSVWDNARYINAKTVHSIDGKIAKEICMLASDASFRYSKK